MTDAETLAVAYFRQEYQIEPAEAKLLFLLWNNQRPLVIATAASTFGLAEISIRVYVSRLRKVLSPGAIVSSPGAYRLGPQERAEIDRMLFNAASDLLAQFGTKAAA